MLLAQEETSHVPDDRTVNFPSPQQELKLRPSLKVFKEMQTFLCLVQINLVSMFIIVC